MDTVTIYLYIYYLLESFKIYLIINTLIFVKLLNNYVQLKSKMIKKFIFISLALVYLFSDVNATHIRAGEIIAKRISSTSLTYEFTIIGYTDTGSEVEFGGGKFDFGDGNIVEVLDESAISANKIQLENQVALNLFKVIHTFQAPGRYVVSYYEQNRNDQIVNMENSLILHFLLKQKY